MSFAYRCWILFLGDIFTIVPGNTCEYWHLLAIFHPKPDETIKCRYDTLQILYFVKYSTFSRTVAFDCNFQADNDKRDIDILYDNVRRYVCDVLPIKHGLKLLFACQPLYPRKNILSCLRLNDYLQSHTIRYVPLANVASFLIAL